MSCIINSGITVQGCLDNSGGIELVLLTNRENVTAVTINATTSVVTAITMATGSSFYAFTSNKNSGYFNQKISNSVENGTSFVEQEIKLNFTKSDATKRNIVRTISIAETMAIVKDFNNNYWLCGYESGLYLTEGLVSSGEKRTDANGYQVTLKSEEPTLAYSVDSSIIDALY